MQNVMMDLMKQFNDNAVSSAKRVGELNMNTFETISAKQAELMNYTVDAGYKNAEALSKAKDPQSAFAIQQEAFQAYSDKLSAATTETTDLLTAAGNELKVMTEEAAKVAVENNEKFMTESKQAVTEGMAKVMETVELSVAKGVEMTEEAVSATKDAADKVVAMSKESAKQAVAAAPKKATKKKVAA